MNSNGDSKQPRDSSTKSKNKRSSSSSSSNKANTAPVVTTVQSITTLNPTPRLLSKKSSFICKPPLRFLTAVPNLDQGLLKHTQPKMLKYPFKQDRFFMYHTTSLEKNYKHLLHTEQNMGIEVDLVHPIASRPPKRIPMHPTDAILIRAEKEEEKRIQKEVRKESISADDVTWLRKTEYMAAQDESYVKRSRSSGNSTTTIDSPSALNKKSATNGGILGQREQDGNKFTRPSQRKNTFDIEQHLDKIDKTFERTSDVNLENIKHPSKPHLKAEAIYPVYPDIFLWPNFYTQVKFDSDPIPSERYPPSQNNIPFSALSFHEQQQIRKTIPGGDPMFMDGLLVEPTNRGTTLTRRNQMLTTYFLPKQTKNQGVDEETHQQKQKDKNLIEYEMIRDYVVEKDFTQPQEDTYFFILDDQNHRCYYNKIQERFLMKPHATTTPYPIDPEERIKFVKRREFNQTEEQSRRKRKSELMSHHEDHDDDDDEEGKGGGENKIQQAPKKQRAE